MKRSLAVILGTFALCGLGQTASAENPIKNLLDAGPAKTEASSAAACDECCKHSGFFIEGELLFLRYHRSDGVRVGDGAGEAITSNDFEFSPRITVGYVFDNGLGVRARWWEFEASLDAPEAASRLDVDTFNIDVELFERFPLSSCWSIEISGGIRYNDFSELMVDQGDTLTRLNSFDGYGGIIGIEAQRSLGQSGALYARARLGVLMGDKSRNNNGSGAETLLDSTQGMIELALGYEFNRELNGGSAVFGRIGAEFQHWFNYSSAFDGTGGEAVWDGDSAVGFGGFGISLGLRY